MNPAVMAFASGDSLYFGAILLLLAVIASPHLKRRWMWRSRNIIAWASLALIVMSSAPISWFVDVTFFGVFGLWFVTSNWPELFPVGSSGVMASLLSLFLVIASVAELRHRALPVIHGETSDHLVVIGDSISSGIGPKSPAWTDLLQQSFGVPVRNLAVPGANTVEAQSMAKRITPEDVLVLIEIGGNDMLSGVPGNEFERALDKLLSKLVLPSRTLVMFELPLLPNSISYGRAQRRLAARYGVWLIPKRLLVRVMGGADATVDGLHLSASGASRMAGIVIEALTPVLKFPSHVPVY